MSDRRRKDPEWREFERLVARIESDAGPRGITVTCPDRIRCKVTGRLREVDASIRSRVGTAEMLVTVECRKRAAIQDVTWIEQLVTKKRAIGADRTIAVSSAGFTDSAQKIAEQNGISTRNLSDIAADDLNSLLRLDLVLFWHKACAISRVGVRRFRSLDWKVPASEEVDLVLPEDIDPSTPIFHNEETGKNWSLNDLWSQLQEATDPFEGVQKAQPPVLRTACFPYPGTVTVAAADGPCLLGDVILTVALWIEAESISLDEASRVEYASAELSTIQRVEFASRRDKSGDRRISLQVPKHSDDIADLHTGGNWPDTSNRR
ncbi:MAG: restriction endonuclease [Alphaproteobacteria bacterium]